MTETSLHRRIIAGPGEPWNLPIRGLLRAGSAVYSYGIAMRNRWYDRRGPREVLDVPVISVGNITVGGTGKTPFVMELVRRLLAVQRNPAVVARGYNAKSGGPNDEERLFREHFPQVAYVANPDRIAAASEARRNYGADVIVLDDGFQHRRLGRSLDIVLIDATCPFGYGHLLPRGLLREPLSSLRRADVVVLTRCDQVSRIELDQAVGRLDALAPNAIRLRCTHRYAGIKRFDGVVVGDAEVSGKRAVVFAAVGNPAAFETTVRMAEVQVVGRRWWPDHHRYRAREIASLLKPNRFPPHDLMLTTEKDAVKLASLQDIDHKRIAIVKVKIDFEGDDDTMLDEVINKTLAGKHIS